VKTSNLTLETKSISLVWYATCWYWSNCARQASKLVVCSFTTPVNWSSSLIISSAASVTLLSPPIPERKCICWNRRHMLVIQLVRTYRELASALLCGVAASFVFPADIYITVIMLSSAINWNRCSNW
jgi:hypothetical protein